MERKQKLMNGALDETLSKFLKEVLGVEEKTSKVKNELHEAREELRVSQSWLGGRAVQGSKMLRATVQHRRKGGRQRCEKSRQTRSSLSWKDGSALVARLSCASTRIHDAPVSEQKKHIQLAVVVSGIYRRGIVQHFCQARGSKGIRSKFSSTPKRAGIHSSSRSFVRQCAVAEFWCYRHGSWNSGATLACPRTTATSCGHLASRR